MKELALPVRISFFTFQQIAYVIAIYRKEITSVILIKSGFNSPQPVVGSFISYTVFSKDAEAISYRQIRIQIKMDMKKECALLYQLYDVLTALTNDFGADIGFGRMNFIFFKLDQFVCCYS